jgi:hypothetical protein
MAHNVLDLYDVLDEIGNGAFGIVRKVRRKSDGLVGSDYSIKIGTHGLPDIRTEGDKFQADERTRTEAVNR